MKDNEIIYRIELTNEEYKFFNKIKNDLYNTLSRMSKQERLEYFKSLSYEKNLNFEKEINGTIYQVNNYFNNKTDETITNKIFRLLEKES